MIFHVNLFFTLSFLTQGAVAQLGERMNGIHEARGSIPLSSTKKIQRVAGFRYGLQPFFISLEIMKIPVSSEDQKTI
jgi:hypothetical protein